MADQKYVEYGGRRMEVPEAMTLAEAKSQMARFFPELAEPDVKTKTEQGKITWVFTKKAGRKGAPPPLGRVVKRLRRVRATPVVAPGVLAFVLSGGQSDPPAGDLHEIARDLADEATRVAETRQALLRLPPAGAPRGGIL